MSENTDNIHSAFEITREEMAVMDRVELIEAMEEMQELGEISYRVVYLATSLLSMFRDAHEDKDGLAAQMTNELFNNPTCPKTRDEWETRLLDEAFRNEEKFKVLKAVEGVLEDLKKAMGNKE